MSLPPVRLLSGRVCHIAIQQIRRRKSLPHPANRIPLVDQATTNPTSMLWDMATDTHMAEWEGTLLFTAA